MESSIEIRYCWTSQPGYRALAIQRHSRFLLNISVAKQSWPDVAEDVQQRHVEHDAEQDGEDGVDGNNGADIETWVSFRTSVDGRCGGWGCGAERCHIEQVRCDAKD